MKETKTWRCGKQNKIKKDEETKKIKKVDKEVKNDK